MTEELEKTEIHCLENACVLVRVPVSNIAEDLNIYENSEDADSVMQKYLDTPPINGDNSDDYDEDEEGKYTDYYDDDFIAPSDDNMDNPSLPQNDEPEENAVATEDCADFTDIVSFAKNFVENIVEESEVIAQAKCSLDTQASRGEYARKCSNEFRNSFEFVYMEPKKSVIIWPTIEDFTVDLGAYTIDEYLSNFDSEEDWMYVIYYQGKRVTQSSDLHKYQAIYSLPTWRYPVAQATASIFFIIEVSRAKPPHCSVDVTFNYETFRKIHKPGVSDFQEKWLHYILDSKIKFFQTITY